MADTAIIHAGQLLTLKEGPIPRRGPGMAELSIIYDGAVIIMDGKISWVGPTSGAEQKLAKDFDVDIIDADGRVVMPGFVDANVMPLYGAPRHHEWAKLASGKATWAEFVAEGRGWPDAVRDFRKADEGTLKNNAAGVLEQMVASGTTTVGASTGLGLTTESEVRSLQILKELGDMSPLTVVRTSNPCASVPAEFTSRPEQYVNQVVETLLGQARLLSQFIGITSDEGFFPVDVTRKLLSAAKDQGFVPRLSAGMFDGSGVVDLALEFDARTLSNAYHLTASQVEALAKSATSLIYEPTAAHLLDAPARGGAIRSGGAIRKGIDEGAVVALSTGFNTVTSANWSMPLVWSMACREERLTTEEALTAMTVNGAHALNVHGDCGTLEKGKRGDVCVFNVGDYREIPYFGGANLIYAVLLAGEEVISTEWADEAALKEAQARQ